MKMSMQRDCTWLCLGVFICVGVAMAPAVAASDECRTAALPDGTPAMFCKDRKGNWQQQPGQVTIATATPEIASSSVSPLKAEAKYQGTYEIVAKIPPRNKPRRSLDDLLSGAINNALNTRTERESGGISIEITFDGPSVTALVSGSTLIKTKLVGLVQNGNCILNNPGGEGYGSVRYEGRCGSQGFSGTILGTTKDKIKYTGTFETTVLAFTDNTQKEAERAALQEKCDAGSQTDCVALDQMK